MFHFITARKKKKRKRRKKRRGLPDQEGKTFLFLLLPPFFIHSNLGARKTLPFSLFPPLLIGTFPCHVPIFFLSSSFFALRGKKPSSFWPWQTAPAEDTSPPPTTVFPYQSREKMKREGGRRGRGGKGPAAKTPSSPYQDQRWIYILRLHQCRPGDFIGGKNFPGREVSQITVKK